MGHDHDHALAPTAATAHGHVREDLVQGTGDRIAYSAEKPLDAMKTEMEVH